MTQTPASDAIVSLERVSLRYGRGPDVLSDINLALEPGSFSFITGASGAGKSSLLKLIYLDLTPSRGLISVFGKSAAKLTAKQRPLMRRRIGVVSQDIDLIPHLTVFENAALPLRATGHKPETYHSDTAELLDWVGLGAKTSHYPPTLSGGEKQRVAIARAIMAGPEVLIADEPTGNVDREMGRRLLRLFMEMNRTGTTVIIATHDGYLMDDVAADRYHIHQGQIEAGGPL